MKSHDFASLYQPINNMVYKITFHSGISSNRWTATRNFVLAIDNLDTNLQFQSKIITCNHYQYQQFAVSVNSIRNHKTSIDYHIEM